MWKNWLSFSGSQRAGILILLTLIFIILIIRILLPFVMPDDEVECRDSAFLAESNLFLQSLQQDSGCRAFDENFTGYKNHFKKLEKFQEMYTLFPFDPNTIDSAGFVKLGLKPWHASNILRYRKKGGKFKTPEQFSKVYGLDSLKFKELRPFICIAPVPDSEKDSSKIDIKKFNGKFQVNLVDTAGLKMIKGVSSGLARMIVQYRNKLGGFHHSSQLKEVFSMNEDKFALISPYLLFDSVALRKIRINTASVEKLNAHPYLNFYQAKSLYEYRRRKGRISKITELNKLEDFDTQTVEKIAPYLEFN